MLPESGSGRRPKLVGTAAVPVAMPATMEPMADDFERRFRQRSLRTPPATRPSRSRAPWTPLWGAMAKKCPTRRRRKPAAHVEATSLCESCGEEIVVPVDISGGAHPDSFEDCPVCCQPMNLHIDLDTGPPTPLRSRSTRQSQVLDQHSHDRRPRGLPACRGEVLQLGDHSGNTLWSKA
jgi:hypothetical protein